MKLIKYWGILLILAFLGMTAATGLFSETRIAVKAFDLSVELHPFREGKTVIFLPPVGELEASTHLAPFQMRLTLLNVDLDRLVVSLEELDQADGITVLETQLREKVVFFMLRLAAISFLLGAAAVVVFSRPQRARRALWGGLLAALAFIILFLGTVIYPYDIDAFAAPQYKGALQAAPWVINLSDQTLATVKALGEQLETMTGNLHELSVQLEQLSPVAGGEGLRVLHVSDIHNNPAAFDFMEKVISSFDIDMVIDTGDFTDYGTELESELVTRVASIPVPYLFVPGNHDSPRVIEAMEREGITVLANDLVEVNGLRIAGFADPSSSGPFMDVVPEATLRQVGASAYNLLAGEASMPDVVAVHHPMMGEPFVGKVPVILSGHTHRAQVKFDQNSAMINAGTTGAGGIRGLNLPAETPYSLVVLYFDGDDDGINRLVTADLISVGQFQDSFTLKRYYNR